MSVDIRVPTLGESVTEATIGQWFKKVGDAVAADEPLVELETDKVTIEVPAPSAGILEVIAANPGDTVNVGALIGAIAAAAAGAAAAKPAAAPAAAPAPVASAPVAAAPAAVPTSMPPSPAASKLIAESGVGGVDGSGKRGQVLKEDVLAAIAKTASAPAPVAAAPAPAAPSAPRAPTNADDASREERVKMTRLRLTIARRLKDAQNTAAMLTTFNEVDMTAVMELREKYQDTFVKKYGIKLGFMSIFAKACAKTLLEMPDVNARLDGDDIIFHEFADISFAISTPNGLVVPPIRNVESLKFSDIEFKLKELAVKARDGKLSLDEMSGGTFTITNGGVFGSLMSTPIINEPQSAILGMHAIKDRPMVVNGEIKIRPMMYLALSYDHRVIDGSTSVTFLVKVKNLLEDPMTLLLDL